MRTVLAVLFVLLFCFSFLQAQSLTQKEACKRFMPSVVRIDTSEGKASGFIVSKDGWIATAAHVVFNLQTGERLSAIRVTLPDGSSQLAQVFVDQASIDRDFALLKIDTKDLQSLELGSLSDASPGDDLTIIGYPFSAEAPYQGSISTKFCLSGSVAATESLPAGEDSIDVIYFQGPAVKGISGGPVISRQTGKVVGIQSQKLAGIGPALAKLRRGLNQDRSNGMYVGMGQTDLGGTLIGIIDVLDRHLVNGLGAATGVDDVISALHRFRRQYEKTVKH